MGFAVLAHSEVEFGWRRCPSTLDRRVMLEALPRVLIRSRCSLSRRLRAYLDEKGFAVRLESFDPVRHGRELGRRNPNNSVPVFEQGDGLVLWDSRIIIEYVEDHAPAPALMPKDPECRARLRLLYDLSDVALEPLVRSFAEASGKKRRKKADEIIEAVRSIVPHLSHDGPYAIGKRFSVADLSVPPVLLTAIEDGLDPTRLPIRVRLWLQTVLDRPSMRKLFPKVRLNARAA